MKKLMVAVLGCALVSSSLGAGFQLSLVPEVAIQDRDEDINGVSIGLWNENPSSKFQWQLMGVVNGATGDSVGLQWSLLFLPGIYNYADNYKGGQLGLVNYAKGDFVGAQLGAVNITGGAFKGLQWGAVNYCGDLTGLQLGVVNWAKHSTSGIQIGLANIIPENKWFSEGDLAQGMIFVNWGF